MNQKTATLDNRAMELRQAFDRSFAAAPAGESAPTEAFLAITVGGDNYALRLAQISGLYVDKKVTPLPSRSNELIGLASFRGALVPVYDLRIILGYSATAMPRWLVMVAPQTPVGLAFDCFDGYLELPLTAVMQESPPEIARPYANEVVHDAGQVRTVIHLPSVLETITNRASHRPQQKE